MSKPAELHQKELTDEFDKVVNMTPSELEKWLQTDESKSVGQTEEGNTESIGHKSGKHIVAILAKNKSQLTDSDYEHMGKVISYIKRHSAQKPDKVAGSNWAYSLKNWGHDPEKT